MRHLQTLFRNLFRRTRVEHDLDEELRCHLRVLIDLNLEQGMSPAEAERAARMEMGGVMQVKESVRDVKRGLSLDPLLQDIRYGLRALRNAPGFTAVAVLSLALGIGANTAIFTILNAVLLRSLPVSDPGRLVQVGLGGRDASLTNPQWEAIRDHQDWFSGMLAYGRTQFDLANGGESQFVQGFWASGNFFHVLGVPAIQGRVLNVDDDRHGGGAAGPVAVISHGFWQRRYGGDPNVVGKTIHLDRKPFQIIGITPAWFTGMDVDRGYDVAIPIGCRTVIDPDSKELTGRSMWWLRLVGRLADGMSLKEAQDRLTAITPEILKATLPEHFGTDDQSRYLQNRFTLSPAENGFSSTRARYKPALFLLMATVGLVLLIACANIANLLLARATARQREICVRMAIGAGRFRVIRQLMTESLLLAGLGAAAGSLLALGGSRLLVSLMSTKRDPVELDLSPDLHVLAFTIGGTVLTAFLFGMAPALRATAGELNEMLAESARSMRSSGFKFHLGKALVAGQVALSLLLLVGAGLFLGSLRNLLSIDPGFRKENVLIASADVTQARIPKERRVAAYQDMLERIRRLPGVAVASSAVLTPLEGREWNNITSPEGFVAKSRWDSVAYMNRVSPGYFHTLQMALLLGRDFTDHDTLTSQRVAIINETAARDFYGPGDPIGKILGIPEGPMSKAATPFLVVGVARDAKYRSMGQTVPRTVFLAAAQEADPWPQMEFLVRTSGPVEGLAAAVRSAILEVNSGIALEFRSFETQVDETLSQPKVVALLSAVFGAVALLLAVIGLYGVTSYSVARRRGEIGIRLALGAQRTAVVWLVLRDVLVLLAVGVAAGAAGALAAGRFVGSLLYGLEASDPKQFIGAAALLAAATAVAAYLPARRAATMDPMAALREE